MGKSGATSNEQFPLCADIRPWNCDIPGTYDSQVPGIDFVIDTVSGKDIEILQLTDPQICSPYLARTESRIKVYVDRYYSDGITDFESRCGRYIQQILRHCNPDLIVVSGDMICGETDDSGKDFLAFIEYMDSLGIPWACCFGNHDNESNKGVLWQCEMLQKAKNCLFRRGNVTGNSNYNIVFRQDGEFKYGIYLLDSNGCQEKSSPDICLVKDNPDFDLITQTEDIYDDQIKWFSETNRVLRQMTGNHAVPNIVFQHFPVNRIYTAAIEKYKTGDHSETLLCDKEGDFGMIRLGIDPNGGTDRSGEFVKTCRQNNTLGIFFGNNHFDDASIECDGIRFTFGSKTGTYDDYLESVIGGTRIILKHDEPGLFVEHLKNQELSAIENA